jgi:glycosyltransferase involved in cell wall biosynthesis
VILHVDLERDWGGGQRQLFLLASRLDPRKQPSVLLCRRNSALGRAAVKAGLRTIDYRGLPGLFLLAPRLKGVSLIHTHSSASLTAGLLLRFLLKKPLVHTRRFVSEGPLTRLSVRRLASCDRVVAISATVRKQMLDSGFPAKKVLLIPSAVEAPVRAAGKKGRGRFVIGTVGKLSILKNHICLIRAAARLQRTRDDFEVRIIGDGYHRKTLERAAAELGVISKVQFLGFRTDALDLMTGFDVFVLTSRREGLGTSVLDAVLRRIPVVVPDIPVMREIVRNGRSGLFFDPEDPEDLARKLDSSLRSTGARKRMASAAYREVSEKFSLKKMVGSYAALYRSLTKDGPAG